MKMVRQLSVIYLQQEKYLEEYTVQIGLVEMHWQKLRYLGKGPVKALQKML